MRKRLFEIIETATDGDRISSLYDSIMVFLIVASLVPLAFKAETRFLSVLDKGCACVFTVDYLLRLITADYKLKESGPLAFVKYPFTLPAIIDLLSILPSFAAINGSFKVLRLFRAFRALRVLRVFKAARYSRSVRIILGVFQSSKDALLAVGSLAVIYVLVSALVILNIEPDSFDNFFEAIYWATVSLTTMGYGDIYPVSSAGRMFTMLSAAFGIAIIALPAGIITAGYMGALEESRRNKEMIGGNDNGNAVQKIKEGRAGSVYRQQVRYQQQHRRERLPRHKYSARAYSHKRLHSGDRAPL